MVNCHASVKGLFAGIIMFSFTILSTLLYAILRNKIGDGRDLKPSSLTNTYHGHVDTEPILHSLHTLLPMVSGSNTTTHESFTTLSKAEKRIDYSIAILEIVNLCLLTISLCATVWALIKIRKLNYLRTTTGKETTMGEQYISMFCFLGFDDVLIIVSLTGTYMYSIFSAFAIISKLNSSTWVAYIKLAVLLLGKIVLRTLRNPSVRSESY